MADGFLTSKLLPIPHGFTTRSGGVSEGPYASLNVGFSVGDAPERVRENLLRVARAANVEPSRFHTASQVHGDRVLDVVGEGQGFEPRGEADALVTSEEGALVSVKTADCVPVLLVHQGSGQVAAVHAGWRGTEAEIASKTVAALTRRGARPAEMVAAIGPHIRSCCYEVSSELATKFQAKVGHAAAQARSGATYLDLAHCVRLTLREAGVADERIDDLVRCTSCEPEFFFSHRRDKGVSGRQLSFAVCRFSPL